jgi:hypothetical protein
MAGAAPLGALPVHANQYPYRLPLGSVQQHDLIRLLNAALHWLDAGGYYRTAAATKFSAAMPFINRVA